jgi:hypothetical protein
MSKKVKVTRTIVYDFDDALKVIRHSYPWKEISEEEIMDKIDEWVYEDFQSPVTLNLLNMEFIEDTTGSTKELSERQWWFRNTQIQGEQQ